MARIRLEAALETSEKWQITDPSLLRWRKKLKRLLFINCDKKLMRSTVQRFEWFADGATEFLKFIELVRKLFTGKELHHKIVQGNNHLSSELWLEPFGTTEHGTQAHLIFTQTDGSPRVGNIYFSIVLQISESTDIFGTAIKCLQLFAPHFKCTFENIQKELTQLSTQCLSWIPPVRSNQKDLVCLQNHSSQWMRPNPLCCKKHNQHELRRISNPDMVGLLDDSSYLKAGIHFAPHHSLEDMLPTNRNSELVAIVGEDQHCLHVDVTLEQLEGIMLPKAIDYFNQNTEATIYKMIWKSKHSYALIQVEKVSMSTQKTVGGARKRKLLEGHDVERISRKGMISHLFDLWPSQVPTQLTSAFKDWLQKQKQS
ncbi:hypothetical protein HU200_027943 [Digitaria exilis]|uniref:Uncharacterized protein n=1 Tax=Digitaria exilis TaxID=1010633 RepID=A0A835EU68_9POAL|nr:hypothetical protein HU200_027943 [Digitaria exilis]